jgi:hypothetical protein
MVLDHMLTKDDVIELLSHTTKLDLPLEKKFNLCTLKCLHTNVQIGPQHA